MLLRHTKQIRGMRRMQNLNYWKQFENTGKVEDYLSYCSSCVQREETYTSGTDVQKQAGGNPYGGIPMGNRNGIKADACR